MLSKSQFAGGITDSNSGFDNRASVWKLYLYNTPAGGEERRLLSSADSPLTHF